ncbi:hypothetical protein PshuTeo2_10110 [Pseudomonas hunanensis]|nr:hypothetical protein [Pseudomonas hunanensis]
MAASPCEIMGADYLRACTGLPREFLLGRIQIVMDRQGSLKHDSKKFATLDCKN